MAPWLTLSLSLWLGQTPEVTPPLPPDADVQMPALDVGGTPNGSARAVPQGDVAQLRAQVEELQTQVDSLQQQLTGIRESATELERLRLQRIEEIERAGTWLAAADQALAVGELDVGDALREADTALAQVIQNATAAGSGRTVVLVEGARDLILRALEATGRRDTTQARWDLFYAAERLREARRINLDEPSVNTVTR